MADFYDEFVSYLKSKSGVTAEVGAGAAARIYPEAPKQAARMPFLVIAEGSGGQSYQHMGGITGVAECVFHVYAYAASSSQARDVAEAVRLAGPLQGFKGTMGSTAVQGVMALQHRDCGEEKPLDKSYGRQYWCRRVYMIHHTEATS